MNYVLNKKITEMTTLELMEHSYFVQMAKSPSMNIEEFEKITGWSRRKVYTFLRNQLIPEHLIVGGYNKRQSKKPIFYTKEVIEWLKN